MNRVVLVGRVTRDPELRTAGSGNSFAPFTLAINRIFQSSSGEKETDFINCVVFGKQAENFVRFMKKGSLVGVEGRLQSNSYTAQDGSKRTSHNVVCDSVSFLESKSSRGDEPRSQGSFNDFSPYDDSPQPKWSKPSQPSNYSPYDEMSKQQKNQEYENESDDFNISDDDLPF